MDKLTITKEITIDANPERVWEFVNTGEGLSRWFGSEVRMNPEVDGDFYEITVKGGTTYELGGRVLVVAPPRKLLTAIRIITPEESRWDNYTLVSILLDETGDGNTHVTLEHTGFEDTPHPQGLYEGFIRGWGDVLERLQAQVMSAVPQ